MTRRLITFCSIMVALMTFPACRWMKADPPSATTPNFIVFSKIDKAWQYSQGAGVKVAVCDWLFDLRPPVAQKYVNPTSMVPGLPVGADKPWHGEWMAELVHQTAPQAKIIPLRARGRHIGGDRQTHPEEYEPYLIRGIRFAADQGAVAVTSSMGPVRLTKELQAAIAYAEKKGTVFINVHPIKEHQWLRMTKIEKRAIYPGLVSVPHHRSAPESGRDIYVWPYSLTSTYADGWGYSNGPPIVAGVVALMKDVNPGLTPGEIKSIIVSTGSMKNGFRVLDAEAAVREALRQKK